MNLKLSRQWIIAPCLLFVALGCNNAPGYTPQPAPPDEVAKVATGQETGLVPLTIGATWIYLMETSRSINGEDKGGENGTIQFKVAKSVPKNNGTEATIEVSREGQLTDRQTWLLNAKGLYQVSVGLDSQAYYPMQPLVIFPVVDNATFSFNGKGPTPVGKPGTMNGTAKILASQGLDTELGRMAGIPVESTMSFAVDGGKGQMLNTTWFKPGVGIVRLKQVVLYQAGSGNNTFQIRLETVLKLRTYKVTP